MPKGDSAEGMSVSVIDKFRQAVVALSAKGQRHEQGQMVRKAVVLAGTLARKPQDVARNLAGLQATADLHAAETGSWVAPGDIREGRGGPFDTCDLRHWLALAERAGVPFVPAVEILVLDEEEMGVASGQVTLPDNRVVRRMRKTLSELPEIREAEVPEAEGEDAYRKRRVSYLERAFAAMDNVPEGWMVRSARCGSSELKALAGMGVSGPTVPEVRFGPDLEIGPGWIRNGNRRRVNAGDQRTVEAAAQGPGGAVFLARPWVPAARWVVGEDPHRHGTQYAGKGAWPVEWRAFVERGRVVGVASYYGWCGSADPHNAGVALEVRDLAQRIADEAVATRAYPRYMDVEFLRASGNPQVTGNAGVQAGLDLFGREEVGCTLDFIEVEGKGLMLLEGGPGNTPFGGGHPCAFAGCGGPPRAPNKTQTVGVAFRTMDHVHLADPSTWVEGDRTDRILTWEEVALLAEASPAPAP